MRLLVAFAGFLTDRALPLPWLFGLKELRDSKTLLWREFGAPAAWPVRIVRPPLPAVAVTLSCMCVKAALTPDSRV